MSAESIKAQIAENLEARLATITTANGYTTGITKVFRDNIPIGMSLPEYELPAIFIMGRVDNPVTKFPIYEGYWEIVLALFMKDETPDSDLYKGVRNIYKAIYANSPVEQTHDFFRIHPSVVEIVPGIINEDLHMINANRVIETNFYIRFRTQLFNL